VTPFPRSTPASGSLAKRPRTVCHPVGYLLRPFHPEAEVLGGARYASGNRVSVVIMLRAADSELKAMGSVSLADGFPVLKLVLPLRMTK
jgi:hypothetical protein